MHSAFLRWAVVVWATCGVVSLRSADQPAVPAGYQMVYEQNFDKPEALQHFAFTDSEAWKLHQTQGTNALELAKQSNYQPAVRSPVNIALLAGQAFGDFVLEANFIQTGKEYGHRDMCVFFGFQDPKHFYYVHMATKADDHAHNIFIVNGTPRTKIAEKTTQGVDWGLNLWHRVRIERRLEEGTVKVFFDDMTSPIMTAKDTTFKTGHIGFGSFDDTGMVDNIRIWAPTSEKRTAPGFK